MRKGECLSPKLILFLVSRKFYLIFLWEFRIWDDDYLVIKSRKGSKSFLMIFNTERAWSRSPENIPYRDCIS